MIRNILLLLAGVAAATGFLLVPGSAPVEVRILLKILPTAMMGTWMVLQGLDKTNWTIFAGLVFALLGDATLELAGQPAFVVGIVFNMAALVFYTIYFVRSDHRPLVWRAVPFLAAIGGVFVAIRGNLGSNEIPVLLYCLLYVVFLWRASARLGDPAIGPWAQGLSFAGALVLTVSDSLLAFSYFTPDHPVWLKPVILGLWWTGLLLLVLTAEIRRRAVVTSAGRRSP